MGTHNIRLYGEMLKIFHYYYQQIYSFSGLPLASEDSQNIIQDAPVICNIYNISIITFSFDLISWFINFSYRPQFPAYRTLTPPPPSSSAAVASSSSSSSSPPAAAS